MLQKDVDRITDYSFKFYLPKPLYDLSPAYMSTHCKKWAIAAEAKILSDNGRLAKYSRSTANGLCGEGKVHSLTSSAKMSHILISERKT